jgi:hypothetical protein
VAEPEQVVNPNVELPLEPSQMTDEQKREAALREHYWTVRQLRQYVWTSSYVCELLGVPLATLEAAEEQAEQDERDALEDDQLAAGERRRLSGPDPLGEASNGAEPDDDPDDGT